MTMHGDKPIFSQSQEGATLEAYDPTFREKTEAVIRDLLTQYGGLSSGGARNIAQGFTGTTDPSQGILDSLGVLDFTPAGLLFGGQEAKRDFDKAQSGLDYIAPTVGLVFTGAEAFPLTKVMTKPARAFLSNLSRKSPEIEEPLITSASDKPKDPSRRKFIQGAASVPVAAGALSNIPVTKIIDDVAPVVKKVIPKGFRLTDLSSFKKMYDDYTDTVFRENSDMYDAEEMKEIILGEFEVKELKEMGIDPNNITRQDYLDDRIAERLAPNDPQAMGEYDFAVSSLADSIDEESFDGSLVEQIIGEIKEKYPDATDQQIFDELGDLYEGASESFSDFIPKDKLKYKAED